MPRRAASTLRKKQSSTVNGEVFQKVMDAFEQEMAFNCPLPDLRMTPDKLLEQMWRVYASEFPQTLSRAEFEARVTAPATETPHTTETAETEEHRKRPRVQV